jgi:hypothetical protein
MPKKFSETGCADCRPIKGVWKLRVDKSKNATPAPESEVITIVKQHGSYQLTFAIDGYNPKLWHCDRMNGKTVKPHKRGW